MQTTIITTADIVLFAVILFRIAGIMVFAPVFGSGSIPVPVKIVLSLVVALAMTPAMPPLTLPHDFTLGHVFTLVLGESIVGLVIGLTASFIFAGLQLAGQIIGFQLGFSLINIIDPQSQVETSVISMIQQFIGLLLFLLINGHHWFFLAVSESFTYLPVDGIKLHGPVVQEVIRLSSHVLIAGVQIAGPVLAVTIIADVMLGIIGRAAPHINILIVGLPLKSLVGFGCLSIAFYFLPQLLGKQFESLYRNLHLLLRGLA